MDPNARYLVQLTVNIKDRTEQLLDMLLAKKCAADRCIWLEKKGTVVKIEV